MEASTVFNGHRKKTLLGAFPLNRAERQFRFRASMRSAVVLFAGLSGLLAASAQGPFSKLERTPFRGHDYVRLADWAKPFNLQIRSMRQSEELQLTNSGSRLLFTLESQRAEINGVTVSLSAPVLARNGTAY